MTCISSLQWSNDAVGNGVYRGLCCTFSGDEPFHTTADGVAIVDHLDSGAPVWIDGYAAFNGRDCQARNSGSTASVISASNSRGRVSAASFEQARRGGATTIEDRCTDGHPEGAGSAAAKQVARP